LDGRSAEAVALKKIIGSFFSGLKYSGFRSLFRNHVLPLSFKVLMFSRLAWLGEFLHASFTKAKTKSVGIRQRTERNGVESIRADQGGLIAPNVNQRTSKVLRINGQNFLEKTSKKVQFPPRQFAI
jgi:hypothetical protein